MSKEMAHADAYYRVPSNDLKWLGLAKSQRHRISHRERVQWSATLRGFRELDAYDDREVRRLTDRCHPFAYPAGWVLMPRSMHTEHCLFITEGHVRVMNGPRAGEEYGPGDVIGIEEMNGDHTVHGSLVTLDHLEGIAVDDEALSAARPAHRFATRPELSPA